MTGTHSVRNDWKKHYTLFGRRTEKSGGRITCMAAVRGIMTLNEYQIVILEISFSFARFYKKYQITSDTGFCRFQEDGSEDPFLKYRRRTGSLADELLSAHPFADPEKADR